MIKKILITLIVISLPLLSTVSIIMAVLEIIESSKKDNVPVFQIIWLVVSLIILLMPAHYIWKGTKLIPILSIFPIRVLSMILAFLFFPLAIFFSLWGIWVKS